MSSSSGAAERLRRHLEASAGELTGDVVRALQDVWPELDGSHEERTEARKLSWSRIKEWRWEDPVITFDIERHGQTVHGSSRATVHSWEIDIDAARAAIVRRRRRQIYKMAKRYSAAEDAERIVSAVLKGADCPELKWAPDRSQVRVLIGEVLPAGSAVKLTLAGRRRRLRQAIIVGLQPHGWVLATGTAANTFVRSGR